MNPISNRFVKDCPDALILKSIVSEGDGPILIRESLFHTKKVSNYYVRTVETINLTTFKVEDHTEMVADELLVTFKSIPEAVVFQNNLKSRFDFSMQMTKVPSSQPLYCIRYIPLPGKDILGLLEALPVFRELLCQVESVQSANFNYLSSTCVIPNDEQWNEQWNLVKISAPDAWNHQNSAEDIVVALLDTGVCYTHNDLESNLVDVHYNAIEDGGSVLESYCHGTLCAGIIGARGNNGLGIAGVAWKIKLMMCKSSMYGKSTVKDDAACVYYATTNGAR